MPSSYTKSLKLKFSLDQQNINNIKEDVQKSLSNLKLQGLSAKSLEKISPKLQQIQSKQQHVKDVEDAIKALQTTGMMGKLMSAKLAIGDKEYRGKMVSDAFKDLGDKVKKQFEKIFDDFVESFKTALDNITNYISTSYNFSKSAWNTYTETGLTGADAYAYNMAKQATGVESLEDLSVWFSSQEGAQERWNELIEQYKNQYEQAQKSAKLIQEFKAEYTDLKNEFITDVLQWMSQNKETIRKVMQFALKVFEGLASVIGGLVSFFGGGEEEVSTSDIIKNYTNSSNVTTNNNNFGITVNGTDANEIATQVGDYIQTRLAIR